MKRISLALLLCLVANTVCGFRDPTQPPGFVSTDTKVVKGFVLRGILAANQRQYALINGDYVGVGEKVSNATVVSINRDEVVLRRGLELITLPLVEEPKIRNKGKR